MKDSRYWIDTLGLEEHPEGGYYRETYRASLRIPAEDLPGCFGGTRNACTGIYYLLDAGQFGALHRLCSDEMWHFYAGDPLMIHVIDSSGAHSSLRLGSKPERGEVLQCVVSGGAWFGACLEEEARYALAGCTVSPGFDFQDFEQAKRSELIRLFPDHRAVIEGLTHGGDA